MDANMMTPHMGPTPFFYYTPDPNPENRQHGHFSQHPAFQQHVFPVVPTVPSTPIYSRPNSSCSQNAVPSKGFTSVPSTLTPGASPQMATRPTSIVLPAHPKLMLETELCDHDVFYYPATPPLSTPGSSVGSPSHTHDVLATPLNPMFSGLDGYENVKAEAELKPETPLDGLDWSNCDSPPLTPVYLQSQTQADQQQTISLSTTSISADLLSAHSCPSLSPSPSPYARSVASEQDVDFCDPRNLTVGGLTNPTLAPECAAPAALEEFRGEPSTLLSPLTASSPSFPKQSPLAESFDFGAEIHHGLPSFDDISDFESEDDFVNGLVNLGEHSIAEIKRSRSATCSTTVSLGQDPFLAECAGEFDFKDDSCAVTGLPSPANSGSESDSHKDKKFKKSKKETRKVAPAMNVAAGSQSTNAEEQSFSAQPNASENKAATATGTSTAAAAAGSGAAASLTPAPANRRGRKQSLTEDPSKPFVCELCNHRFRRQEHLKRHYRSLHTQEKPFQCHECGKKFSRSDNLSQHARTHGSGAIVMNLIDSSEEGLEIMPQGGDQDYHNFGKVLFQVASEVAGSSSDSSSDESPGDAGKKKRKRSD
ncbi:hypothetical protein DL770_005739 [Monosporascus sp. CRB-9-2]|nr:hypothetical protein DL770_005739 [Monosporascus sp. CRB-9-2]